MATSAFFGEVKVGLSGGDGEDSLLCLLIIAAHGLPTVSWLEMLTECLQSSGPRSGAFVRYKPISGRKVGVMVILDN
jgi:hypothetical protein